MRFLRDYKQVQIKQYCITCLNKIIKYDPTRIDEFNEEEDYCILGSLIQNNPQITFSCLVLIKEIINQALDELVIKLIEYKLLNSLVEVLQTGNPKNRKISSYILSNISTIPDKYIQNELLEDNIYKPIMKSLFDDIYDVKLNLGFFLAHLIISSEFSTLQILIEKKSALQFLSLVFQQLNSDVELLLQSLNAFKKLYSSICILADHQLFLNYSKQIQETVLIAQIESLTFHQNNEISTLAEGLNNYLQNTDQTQETIDENSSSSIQNVQNQYQQQQMQQIQNNNNIFFNNNNNKMQYNQTQNFNTISMNNNDQIINYKNQMMQE